MSTVTRLLRLATSRSGLRLLDTIVGVVEDLRARGHGNDAIRVRVQSIRDVVRASDAKDGELLDHINPSSLEIVTHAKLEPSVAGAPSGSRYQFERVGYFCVDPDSSGERLVFNRTATLKDSWAKVVRSLS